MSEEVLGAEMTANDFTVAAIKKEEKNPNVNVIELFQQKMARLA